MSDPILALRGISKTFGRQLALDDVEFEVRAGEVHALVGENGSGKSTLIKILSGYHVPDHGGSVNVDGEALHLGSPEASRQQGLRFVHQDLGLIDEFTALENFGVTSGFPGPPGSIQWRKLRSRATELLGRVGVDLDLDAPASSLSAVQRTALAIARCLDDAQLGAPRILVLDEPTAALPVDDVERLFAIVRDVAAHGVGVIYVSHRLDEVLALSDRITAIRDGRIVGTVDAADVDRTSLVNLIIGSDLEPDAAPPIPAGGGRTMIVSGLSAPTLAPVSFQVESGEILGIAGLDGSGREAWVRGLVGAVPGADVERLEVDGAPMIGRGPAAAARAGIALVLANRDPAAAVRGFTIGENVTLVSLSTATQAFVRRGDERRRVDRWIQELDIRPPESDRDYGTLSGGNRQKVIFAKWLDIAPVVLLLDDPTSGVDVGARRSMYAQIREVAGSGVPVVIASSDLEDLARLCTRVFVLSAGHVVAELQRHEITEARMTYEMSARSSADAQDERTPPRV